MLRIAASRSGHPTAYWESYALHSSYDPMKEADRYVAKNLSPSHPDSVVLIGPGLGYLVAAVKARFPGVRTLGLCLSRALFEAAEYKPAISWFPGSGVSLPSFLMEHIGEMDLEGLKVLEWGPCVMRFPEVYRAVADVFSQHLKELRGNIATSSAMGRTWIRNSFVNFVHIDSVGQGRICQQDIPVLIAASGPSIQGLIPALKIAASKAHVWALPSAVPFLLTHDIIPDLIIMTDPGFYSVRHLGAARGKSIPVAMPLSASPGIWRITDKIHLLSEDTFFERELLSRGNIGCPVVPSLGTVAASALALAQKECRTDIFVCGLDMCFEDIQSHAKPNLPDTLLQMESGRLNPHYGLVFNRSVEQAPLTASGVRTSLPLQTYSGWFNQLPDSSRIFRCNPTAVKISSMVEIDGRELSRRLNGLTAGKGTVSYRSVSSYPSRKQRVQIAAQIAYQWMGRLRKCSEEFAATEDPHRLLTDSVVRNLAYYLGLPDLIRLKRLKRFGRLPECRRKIAELLNKMEKAVLELQWKIRQGG